MHSHAYATAIGCVLTSSAPLYCCDLSCDAYMYLGESNFKCCHYHHDYHHHHDYHYHFQYHYLYLHFKNPNGWICDITLNSLLQTIKQLQLINYHISNILMGNSLATSHYWKSYLFAFQKQTPLLRWSRENITNNYTWARSECGGSIFGSMLGCRTWMNWWIGCLLNHARIFIRTSCCENINIFKHLSNINKLEISVSLNVDSARNWGLKLVFLGQIYLDVKRTIELWF